MDKSEKEFLTTLGRYAYIQKLHIQDRKIERSIFKPGTIDNELWSTNAPKKDRITKWANILEELHYHNEFPHPVNMISTYIGDKLRQAGYDSAIHWVRHSLPFKYKNEAKNRSEDFLKGDNDKDICGSDDRKDSSDLFKYYLNKRFINYFEETIELLQILKKKCETSTVIEAKLDEAFAEQMFMNWAHIIKRCRQSWDDRQTVLTGQQYLMGFALAGYSSNYASIAYQRYVKKYEQPMTEKQASKYKTVHISDVDDLFDPITFVQSKELGFIGLQCDQCGSWRTVKKWNEHQQKDMMFCYQKHTNDTSQWSALKPIKMQQVVIE